MDTTQSWALALRELAERVAACRACPRLVRHRERVAADPPRRFRGQPYWARPVPGFGDPEARVLFLGLAPAANGANRTGRMFTGDRSGEWLYRALYEAGFSSEAHSEGPGDGLTLKGAFISAAAHCSPPGNKPTAAELAACRPFLLEEMSHLRRLRVVVALGGIGWNTYLSVRRKAGLSVPRPKPRFGHGATCTFDDGLHLLGSYHPSQQNTFTGRLTRDMLAAVMTRARELAGL